MANWKKYWARWDAQDAYREKRQAAMTDAEKKIYEQKEKLKVDAWMAASRLRDQRSSDPRDGMTSIQTAQYELEHSAEGSLKWHLADAQLNDDIWCSLGEDVFNEQDRQAKMREKYGAGWSGRVKIKRFQEGNKRNGKPHAWRIVRWLEKRGFVEVGNGYVKWVGALE